MPEDFIVIIFDHDSAKNLARLLREVSITVESDALEEIALAIGSHMGICSNSNEQDELDVSIDESDTITGRIYDSFNMPDNASCTEFEASGHTNKYER